MMVETKAAKLIQEVFVWAHLENPNITIEEGIQGILKEHPGTQILEIDTEKRAVKLSESRKETIFYTKEVDI